MPVSRDSLSSVVKNARRGAGMTQSDLAKEVGCTQSAISMFEAGKHDALSDKNIQAIALMLGLDIESLPSREELKPSPEILKYCPIDECPSNIPYVVHGRVLAKPSLTSAPSARKSRCRDCGELLESMCTECHAPVSEGTCCAVCGTPYVTIVERDDPVKWAAEQRMVVLELRGI